MEARRIPRCLQGRQWTTTGALAAVFVCAAYSWLVTPHVASLRASQQYERAAEVRAERSRLANQRLRAEQSRLQELAAQYARLADQAFLPNEADEFFRDMAVFCERNGCAMVSLGHIQDNRKTPIGQPGEANSPLFIRRSAALKAHGTYGSIVKLIETLGARRQKIWIDALRLRAADQGSGRVACEMVVTIYVNLDKENPDDEQAQCRP